MARHKSKLSRALNLKPRAYTFFRALTAPVPVTRQWLSFYPDIAPLPERVEKVSEAIDYTIKLSDPSFQAALDVLAIHNWDVVRPHVRPQDPFLAKRFIGIVNDVLVPGHTLTPVDPQTRRQIGFEQQGRSNWNFAHPGLSTLRTRRITEASIIIPPFWNYWHLFLEHLLPLIQAARIGAWGDAPLKVITRSKRPPLIDAVIRGLQAEGFNISVLEVGPYEQLHVDRLMIAVSQCWNSERSHALAETIPSAWRIFSAAYGEHRIAAGMGERLYISRRGSKLRQIVNEDELIAALKRLDFTVLQANWNNHPEQLSAFSHAKTIVGVHGAGMSNIVFAQPGTRVMELFPFDHRKTSMLHLSAEHDLVHCAYFGSGEERHQAFAVDVAGLVAAVEGLL